MKWLLGVIATLVGALMALFKGRQVDKLEKERDAAQVNAKAQEIKAEARAHEVEKLRAQQNDEDATRATDRTTLKSMRDNMY
jgi:hypothetical protein